MQNIWLHTFTGCSHNCDLETYFSIGGMVNFEGNFAKVKIVNFPQKAAAGLCLFICMPCALLLLCLICSTVLHTRPTRPFSSFLDEQFLAPDSHFPQLSPQSFKNVSSFPSACTQETVIQEQLIPPKSDLFKSEQLGLSNQNADKL